MRRRNFIAGVCGALGAGIAGTAWWAAVSRQRAAVWARRIVRETGRPILPSPLRPDPDRWSDHDLTLSWLGHATVLVNFFGVRILTDPALGSRVGVSLGVGTAGPKRFVAPALTPDQLPPADVVLVSHAHMDHLDLPTLGRLNRDARVVTASATADLFQSTPLKRVDELRWGQQLRLDTPRGPLEIEAFEVRHWGKRWPSERPRGYNGYIVRREGKSLLFAGDTALTPLFRGLKSKGPFEAAIMPIGAYNPWIWNHCTPEEALDMANAARARFIVPVHHQTFRLSEEPMEEPIARLKTALAAEPERLALSRIGETFVCPVT